MYDVQTALCDVETPLYDLLYDVMSLYYVQTTDYMNSYRLTN